MIVYKYFLGCNSYTEVKAKYKELVKVHHPDMSTGSHEAFVALQAEYSILGEGNYYPLKNSLTTRIIYSEPIKEKETTTHLNQEELEKARAINYFTSLRINDITFDYIDEVIKQAKKDSLNKLWIYQEIQKKWDLNLDHFKYVTFVCNDKVAVAKELFRKYQLNVV